MKFQLARTLAKEFSIRGIEVTKPAQETESIIDSLKISIHVPKVEDSQSFAVCFQIKVTTSTDESLEINCEYWAFFEGEQPLTQEFLDGPFTMINAPAIAYPYLRSFITTTLVSAGYPALYLPTVNFVELAKSQLD